MPTTFLTGASSGIGLELARIFVREGYDVILVARNKEKLDELRKEFESQGRVLILSEDLSQPGAVQRVITAVEEKGWQVDVLVNNAGFGLFGPYTETDANVELNMIDLNVRALTELTKLVLPGMLERKSGRILNVGSVASFLPGPYSAVYYATKAYVLSYSEALASELSGTGVTVTVLCPGGVRTGFEERAGGNEKLFRKAKDPKVVAEAGYRALMEGKRIEIPSWKYCFMVFCIRFTPRWLVTRISRFTVMGK